MQPRRYRIDLGYEGTAFSGSQRQPGLRTVQGVLEEALARVVAMPVRVALAGRTDAGVHAVGQVASCDLVWRHDAETLVRALRASLPEDIVIYRATVAPAGFHARRCALDREYRYRIWLGTDPPLFLRRFVWVYAGPIDLQALQAAADFFVGTHDFRSFAGHGMGGPAATAPRFRTIDLSEWHLLEPTLEPLWGRAQILEYRVRANGFLPHMVRTMVAALLRVGTGDVSPDWIVELLRVHDRRAAPAPAPARGLVLWRVRYPEDVDCAAGYEQPPLHVSERKGSSEV
ncbi:MAG: tRNA pseudouridine(38-40) synthase TruA [Thermomicrobium sp.]|nr:tRNA pseudouridine(38-40) synthase TruA [Thermomicrobium sp.]MCS7246341.1 tRNA pseudouridine(38-40) synthase TruA [Thermomicrobium sp.]MDW7982408.1 tRNA pseudouridine(38-40) synthase TruA [Thermomicrobium sp.]